MFTFTRTGQVVFFFTSTDYRHRARKFSFAEDLTD